MADNLPIQFPLPAENANLSFDFLDFATGAGYKAFYPLGVVNASNVKAYSLTTDAGAESDDLNYQIAADGVDPDLDFDIEFKKHTIISASDVIIDYSLDVDAIVGKQFTPTFTLYKVQKDSTEVSIGSVVGTGDVAGGSHEWRTRTCKFAATRTPISPGEKLRFHISASGDSPGIQIQFTPSGGGTQINGKNGTWTRQLKVLIPFEVQI